MGHGTRNAVGTEEFFQLAKRLSEQVSPQPVSAGLLELQKPDIPQAWEQLIADGVRSVRVIPMLLFAAGHAKRDVPEILTQACETARQRGIDVCFSQRSALECHPKLLELSHLRFQQAVDAADHKDLSSTAVIMVGRGSLDPSATAEMYRFSELRGQRERPAVLRTGFVAMAQPKIVDVIEEVGTLEDIHTVIVQPHLLFEGDLNQRIRGLVDDAAQKFRDRRWIAAERLGPHRLLAEALID